MTPLELREVRESLGLGTPRFGRLLGTEGRTIQRYEAGDRAIPGPVAVLAAALRDSRAVRRYFGVSLPDDPAPKSE